MSLITTPEIIESHRATENIVNHPDAIRSLTNTQLLHRTSEEKLLLSFDPCPSVDIKTLHQHLGSFNVSQLQSMIQKHFDDPAIMRAAACITYAIVNNNSNNKRQSRQRIRTWILNLRPIRSDLVDTYSLYADLALAEQYPPFYVIKAPREPHNSEMLHEYFVGTFCLNPLRAHIPNFAYIYGGFKCSPPWLDRKNNNIIAWCNNDKVSVQYVLYENTQPAISFKQYVQTCTFGQFLNKYLQVMYALRYAQKACDFTHYDLTDENILLRQVLDDQGNVDSNFSIVCLTERNIQEFIVTDLVATITDYAFAHVRYQGQDFGNTSHLHYGVLYNKSFLYHDAYKLLLYSMRSMLQAGNRSCFEGAAEILSYFNIDESAEEIVLKQKPLHYYLPYLQAFENIPFDDYLRFIRQNFNPLFIRTQTGPERVLGCLPGSTDLCSRQLNTIDVLNDSGLNSMEPISARSILEFYDIGSSLTSRQLTAFAKNFIPVYNQLLAETLNQYQAMTENVISRANVLMPFQLEGIALSTLLNPAFLEQYQNYTSRVIELYDDIQRMTHLKEALVYTSKNVEIPFKSSNKRSISQLDARQTQTIAVARPKITNAIKSILNGQNYIQRIYRERPILVDQVIAEYPPYQWYWTQFNTVSHMFNPQSLD